MDNRETLTPSSGDAILKRHLFSGVAKNWIKDRGDVGRAYFVRRPSRQSFGFRVAASSGPIPKAPGSAGGYLHVRPGSCPPSPRSVLSIRSVIVFRAPLSRLVETPPPVARQTTTCRVRHNRSWPAGYSIWLHADGLRASDRAAA